MLFWRGFRFPDFDIFPVDRLEGKDHFFHGKTVRLTSMKKQGCENTFLPSGFLLPSTRPIFDSGIITLPSLRKWETLSLYFSPNSNFTQQRYRWKDSPDTEDIFRAVP